MYKKFSLLFLLLAVLGLAAGSCWQEAFRFIPGQPLQQLEPSYARHVYQTVPELQRFVDGDMAGMPFVIEHNACDPQQNRVRPLPYTVKKSRAGAVVRTFAAVGTAVGGVMLYSNPPALAALFGGAALTQIISGKLANRPPKIQVTEPAPAARSSSPQDESQSRQPARSYENQIMRADVSAAPQTRIDTSRYEYAPYIGRVR